MALVDTRYGKVEGIEKSGILQFRGIPFAAPPVGARRWRPPEEPAAWHDVWMADRFRPRAPQARNAGAQLLPAPQDIEASEDCLYLNVFTPGTGSDPKPVMVWIHGGGFTGGSGRDAWYNGTSFARNNMVVVTINYRLGALGFMHMGDDFPGSGNCGILDQIAALEWVRDNIENFGGDPGNVTVFGESAGGMSIGTLLGTPAAAGLFDQAVPQSGAAANVHTVDRAAEITDRVTEMIGGRDALLSAPADRIVEVAAEVAQSTRGAGLGLGFQPVVDGVVLRSQPIEAIRNGQSAGVRVMTGTTRDEMTLFLAPVPGFTTATEDDVVRRLDRAEPGRGRQRYDSYRDALGPEASPRQLWVAIETDRVFRIPAIRLAEAQTAHNRDVWMYLFAWESPLRDGLLGSCHALEIPFVWNSLSARGTEVFAGGGPAATALAAEMHRSWIAFATAGGPGWDRYDASRRATRVFGPGGGVVDDPMGETRRLWERASA